MLVVLLVVWLVQLEVFALEALLEQVLARLALLVVLEVVGAAVVASRQRRRQGWHRPRIEPNS